MRCYLTRTTTAYDIEETTFANSRKPSIGDEIPETCVEDINIQHDVFVQSLFIIYFDSRRDSAFGTTTFIPALKIIYLQIPILFKFYSVYEYLEVNIERQKSIKFKLIL